MTVAVFGWFFAAGAGLAAGIALVALVTLEIYRRRYLRLRGGL